MGSIPGLGRSPGEGNGNTLQYSCLENPMDGGVWVFWFGIGSHLLCIISFSNSTHANRNTLVLCFFYCCCFFNLKPAPQPYKPSQELAPGFTQSLKPKTFLCLWWLAQCLKYRSHTNMFNECLDSFYYLLTSSSFCCYLLEIFPDCTFTFLMLPLYQQSLSLPFIWNILRLPW